MVSVFFAIKYYCSTLLVKNSLKIALFLTVSEIFAIFYFPLKFKMAAKVAKIEILPLCRGYSCSALWVKNSLEISLSLTVSQIFTIFYFPHKFKMAAKRGGELKIFPFVQNTRILLYPPMGQKFAQTCSISCGFQDIYNFLFVAKIQDGRQKWQKLKFFPFVKNTLVLPNGSKINSKSLHPFRFRRYLQFLFFVKIQDGHQKWQKLKFFPFALSLTVFEIFVIFHIFTKSSNKVAITHLYIE